MYGYRKRCGQSLSGSFFLDNPSLKVFFLIRGSGSDSSDTSTDSSVGSAVDMWTLDSYLIHLLKSFGTRNRGKQRRKSKRNFPRKYRAQIPPPVTPISIPEPDVPTTFPKTIPIPESDILKSLPKPNIPYPSRRDNQKSHDKASNGEDLPNLSRFALRH
ncbi:hypothetical protein Tco_1385523 [Tanacetum coccineum]